MSATSGGGGSVSEGSEAGGSSHSTMSVSDSPSTSFQANLPENVTKITLSDENSAGGFGADVTGSKINLSLDERHQKDGIVNVAFDYEEGANRGGGGGDFRSVNGSEKKDGVPEAVNLELVNMVPYSNGNGTSYGVPVNGIPMKKDSEQVDMSTPYDEYFVPVNEHKKYMRGEKLYVTKDKRRPTSWRRCLSWIVACTVISVVLIVAILAGTGVILSQEPNFVKEASVGRNFAGSNLKPSVTNKSPTPTSEMYMYVPRSIESEFVIDNLDFDPAFKDRNSSAYQQFATNMEGQLKMLLFDKEALEFGASDVALKIVNISRDPFKVNYRIGWNYKQGVNNPPEPIKMEDVKKRLVESLARNQGYIDKYHVDREAIKVNHVINTCQMDNGGCSHICYYNYITQQFTCTCPTHLVLDSTGKNCVAWSGSSEDDALPVPSRAGYPEMPYESTASSVQEHDFNVYHEHGLHQGVYHENNNNGNSKFSSEAENENHGNEHGDYEPEAEPAPEPTAEPNSEEKTIQDGHNVHSFHDISGGETVTEQRSDPGTDDRYHDQHVHSEYEPTEPSAKPTLDSTDKHDFGSKNHEHSGHSDFVPKEYEPSAEPTPEPTPEPTAETNSEGRSFDHINGFKNHEPAREPTPEPAPEHDKVHNHYDSAEDGTDQGPASEPIPEPGPEPTANGNTNKNKQDHIEHSIYVKDHDSAVESKPEPEPAGESNSESKTHNHDAHFVYGSQDHEPTAEPTAEPTPEPTPEPAPEPTPEHSIDTVLRDGSSTHKIREHEPSAEPTLEPLTEFNSEGKIHDHAGRSDESKDRELPAELAPKSTAKEDFINKDRDSAVDSLYVTEDFEPATEPTREPVIEGITKEQNIHSIYESQSGSESKQSPQRNTTQKSNTEPAPESTSESPSDTDLANSGSSERNDTLFPSAKPTKDLTLDSQSPLQNSNQELSSLGNVHMTEPKTEYPMGIYPILQKESVEENKSGHYMPHLEDILIRKPNLNSKTPNATNQNQNPLQNVELTSNGEPIIEEIIINKSGRNSTDQIGLNASHSVTSGHTSNESDSNSNKNSEGFNNHNIAIVSYSDDSSTKGSLGRTEDHGDTNSQSIQLEIPTDHPKIIEYSEVYSTPKIENDKGSDFGQNGSSRGSFETTVGSNDQDSLHSSQHFSGEDKKYNITSETEDLEYKLLNPSEGNIPVTTVHPETQHEHDTIPGFVEFSGPADSTPNPEMKPQMPESNIRERDMSAENPNLSVKGIRFPGPSENEHQIKKDSDDSKNLEGEEHDQVKTQETSTETHPTMTTLLSILTPEGLEKGSGEQGQDSVVREIQNKNKTNLKPPQAENNETTKTPEEISNNIKDELLDNESFNTLIDKEYENKESIPSEGKEIANKYPNKPFKIDKKKLKDYVKNEKETDKKAEVTARPGVTPEDFILQKHVNGNENVFDLDYSLQNEHTTKNNGEVTVIDPQDIPGVSFKPQGINNHDLSVLQTISPNFRTETIFPSGVQELETLKPEPKIKVLENKEGDIKLDRDYKFDKDFKYEKQKVSKKKDLKKKVGGKDGKNVELDDGRKYFVEINKDEWDVSQEGKDVLETTINPSFEKTTGQIETRLRNSPELSSEVTAIPGSNFNGGNPNGPETTLQPHQNFEIKTEVHGESVTEYQKFQSVNDKLSEQSTTESSIQDSEKHTNKGLVNESGPLTIDDPTVKSTFNLPPGTVFDSQLRDTESQNNSQDINSTTSFSSESGNVGISGTVSDGTDQGTTAGSSGFGQGESGQNTSFVVYKTLHSLPEIASEGGVANSTKAHPTIIIHGQSGNLQDGHIRFANSTLHNPGNVTVISTFNGTLSHPEGHSFSFTNYTATFPNGSAVHPTIVVRGQSGALQDGHESRFGNSTFQTFTTFSTHPINTEVFKNSQVYRIENSSLPGTVFGGDFSPEEGHYHMFTNSSGTFVFTNTSTQPVFRIKGESGDFGNTTVYILENSTNNTFSGSFSVPNSVVFRNSTVFAVKNTEGSDAGGVREIVLEPHDVTSNDTIHFSHQMSPSFVSSGTAYKVNNYFGYISKCAAGQFQCVNGTSKRGSACINLSSKCDSINDCSDGSDELGCIENGCPGNFQCSDGTCLKRNLVCNGILDCSDGSDEKNCESWKCEFDEFQCPSGRCIPVVWQCDNKPDCDNHTDEYNCQTSCGNDEYLCPEGWCIPLTYKCNGVRECSNGEDEQLCDCSHEEFKCQTGGCVLKKQVCNGLDDCPDRSDEWDCVKLEPSSNLLKIRSSSGNYEPVCADNWSSRYSDQVCASLGYFSSVPIENENSSITTETSFYVLKNDTTAEFNKKIIVNLKKSEGNCSSGKLVEISCQEFSCGSRSMTDSSSVEARLVGGMSATAGQWPSVALLYNIRNFHSCTANILTPRWVLSSYNCLKMGNKNLNEQDWKFYGGSTVFESEKENAEIRRILSIIPHPQVKFNQFLFTNDLALVELDQSLQFSSKLGAVCLPEQEMQPRQICVTAGWGMNTPEDKAIRQQLQYLPVPTMNLTECNSTEHYSGFITEDKICAGYNSAQKSLCYNEEGAPLMCVNDRGEWELQGVLSYHSNCGRGSHPSIFSSITPVTDWIKKSIGNNFERKALTVTNR